MSVTVRDRIRAGFGRVMADRPGLATEGIGADESRFHVAALMTLAMFLLGTPAQTPWTVPLLMVAGLVHPRLHRSKWFWMAVVAAFVVSPIRRPWLALDNHHWLQVYWLAAIAVSRWGRSPDKLLTMTARYLLGLTFLFAATWKLLAPEFLTGGFFEFAFLADSRLGEVLVALGLQEDGVVRSNRSAISGWRSPATDPGPLHFEPSSFVVVASPIIAWATFAIEAAVAVAMLAPLAPRLRWLRDATLVVFVVTTYPVAPVLGFGRLLLAMGVMQSELRPKVRNWLYAALFVGLGALSERETILAGLETFVGWLGSGA